MNKGTSRVGMSKGKGNDKDGIETNETMGVVLLI